MEHTKNPPYLNEKAVAKDLSNLGIRFELLEKVGSTNDHLREKVKKGEIHQPWATVAINQTEGKGTKGRKWISDDQSCLKMSLCVPFKRGLLREAALSPTVALATCKALLNTNFSGIELKWPNDLLKNGRKVGGILLESFPFEGKTFLIIGIGLNLYPSHFVSMQLDRQPAFLLKEMEADYSLERTKVVTAVISHCAQAVFNFRFGTGMPDPLSWNKHDRLFGKPVTVKLNYGKELAGIACGIDGFGRFQLRTKEGKLVSLEDGEVEIGYGSTSN